MNNPDWIDAMLVRFDTRRIKHPLEYDAAAETAKATIEAKLNDIEDCYSLVIQKQFKTIEHLNASIGELQKTIKNLEERRT